MLIWRHTNIFDDYFGGFMTAFNNIVTLEFIYEGNKPSEFEDVPTT